MALKLIILISPIVADSFYLCESLTKALLQLFKYKDKIKTNNSFDVKPFVYLEIIN